MIIHFGFRLITVNHSMLPRVTMLAYYLLLTRLSKKYCIMKIIMFYETI